MKHTALLIAFLISVTAIAIGQSMGQSSEHGFFQTRDMKWMDGPASLRKGAKVAMLEGNPTHEGPFTMRLQLPDGYTIQPHSHPAVEHVTVISGTFNLGMGEKFDTAGGRALPAGSFAFMQPGYEALRVGQGRNGGSGAWHWTVADPGTGPRKAVVLKRKKSKASSTKNVWSTVQAQN